MNGTGSLSDRWSRGGKVLLRVEDLIFFDLLTRTLRFFNFCKKYGLRSFILVGPFSSGNLAHVAEA